MTQTTLTATGVQKGWSQHPLKSDSVQSASLVQEDSTSTVPRVIGGGVLGGQAPLAAAGTVAATGAVVGTVVATGAVAGTDDGSVGPVAAMRSERHPLAANITVVTMQSVLTAL